MTKFPMTIQGARALEEELKHLKTVLRPQITQAIAEARELGDLKENAEYHAAREQQHCCARALHGPSMGLKGTCQTSKHRYA